MASFPSLADVLGKIDGRLAEVMGGAVPIKDRPVPNVRKMLTSWSDGRGWRGQEGQSEYRRAVRAVLPLMLELAGYLTPDRQGGKDHSSRIHGTLSQALLTLAVAAGTARMEQQRQLCEEFHLLLEDFWFLAWSRQPDLPGLLIDFLKFLDAMDRSGDGENSGTARRVREKLRSLRMLSNRSSWYRSGTDPGDIQQRRDSHRPRCADSDPQSPGGDQPPINGDDSRGNSAVPATAGGAAVR